ncbi:unnamed protein product [Mytilus edulis]|uniref:Uncharacterized protein n=1 Tax=Mytilus edulis TaxID=6550 RepID=A0A8S3T0Y1_MYTED|nr:unnamed protein product [Mytilus edulis]
MACGILVLLIAAIAASTNGYGSSDYYPDKDDYSYKGVNSYSYKPKLVKSSSYSSSSYVSHGHPAGYAGHKLITGHAYRFKVSHMFRRFHRLGVELIGRGIRYNGFYYGRLCSATKLYSALNSCYDDYGDISDCFPGLIKQGLIGRRHIYHKYGHGFGLGVTFVKRGIVYGRSYYKLSCSKRRFYSYWNRCYGRYHNVGRCFGYLRRKHLFSYYNGYSSVGYGAGYSGGIIYDYGYYKSHHGFAIVNNRFTYGGIGYRLKCSRSRFYTLWGQCYHRYHSVGSCFGRLRRQHLFYRYGGITYDYGYYKSHHGFAIVNNRFTYGGIDDYSVVDGDVYGSDYGSGPIFDYSYYNSHHGFAIRHYRFSYNGIAYKLKCSRSRFYRLWGQCYHRYHSVGTCFGRLRSHHLFYRYLGDTHAILNKHLYLHKKIANHHVRRIHNVAKTHVATISRVANKHVHNIQHQANKHVSRIANEARSHINRFKQMVDYHIKRLHKHTKYHLSAAEHQHKKHLNERQYQNNKHELNVRYLHKKHEYNLKKHAIAYAHGLVVSYNDYFTKYHGFKLDHHRFSYGGKGKIKCTRIFE